MPFSEQFDWCIAECRLVTINASVSKTVLGMAVLKTKKQ